MRLFFAVPTSSGVKEIVRVAIGSFPVPDPPWRWIPPENYHITLKFLGEVSDDMMPSLHEAAARVAAGAAPFRMTFGPFGARPRVLFFAVSVGADRLVVFASRVDQVMETAGFEPERRPFRAHLTLARIKLRLSPGLRTALEAVAPLPPSASQAVDRFVLMRSHLSRAGARYEEIGTYPLEGSL